MKVLFVCTGNTCRSPMAEGGLRKLAEEKGLDIEVSSGGLAVYQISGAAENSIKVMDEIGVDLRDHVSRMLDEETVESFDLVLTMAKSHKDMMKSYLDHPGIWTLNEYVHGETRDILDPFGGSLDVYRDTRDEILDLIEEMIKKWEK